MPGVWLISQNTHNIDDGEIPFLLLGIPGSADRLIFKKLDLIMIHMKNLAFKCVRIASQQD